MELLTLDRDETLLSQLASRLRHDLRAPLVNIRLGLQMLEDDPEDRRALVARLVEQVDRAERLVELLVDYAGASEPHLVRVRLGPVLHQLRAEFPRVEMELDEAAAVPIDIDQELRLYHLLLENAQRAAGDQGRVRLRLRNLGDRLEVRVEDSGPGITDADRDRIFEPFVSTWSGTGLGLAVARRAVEARGGSLRAEASEELGGACLVVGYSLEVL